MNTGQLLVDFHFVKGLQTESMADKTARAQHPRLWALPQRERAVAQLWEAPSIVSAPEDQLTMRPNVKSYSDILAIEPFSMLPPTPFH